MRLSLFNRHKAAPEPLPDKTVPSEKEVPEVKDLGMLTKIRMTYSYYYYRGKKDRTPFNEASSRGVHHSYIASDIKYNSPTRQTIAKVLLTILATAFFVIFAFLTHNYLWLIGTSSAIIFLPSIKFLTNFLSLKKRYYNELLKNLSRKKDDPSKPNALVFLPLPFADPNNAFSYYLDTLGPIAKKYNLEVRFPFSIAHMNKIMKEKKYDLLTLCGHGEPPQISFTPDFALRKSEVHKLNFSNLNKNASIILFSCSTGAQDGIGEKIALVANRKVFAPSADALNHIDILYDKSGSIKPQFHALPSIKFRKRRITLNCWPFYLNLFRGRNITREITPESVAKYGDVFELYKPPISKAS